MDWRLAACGVSVELEGGGGAGSLPILMRISTTPCLGL